jgi:hypothetical protein
MSAAQIAAGAELLDWRQRRHADSRRRPPISHCGCISDPEVDIHRCGSEISDVQADAAAAALALLDHLGTPGLFDRATCRAVWRRGFRKLATECSARSGWAA